MTEDRHREGHRTQEGGDKLLYLKEERFKAELDHSNDEIILVSHDSLENNLKLLRQIRFHFISPMLNCFQNISSFA